MTDDRFINALREAVQEIAETMLFVEITPGEVLRSRSEHPADVSAVIGYSGALRGSLRLAGPVRSVLKLASSLLGEERNSLDKEMEDAFAELANMIAGGVQSRNESDLGVIRMSPPVVISGKNHQVSSDRSFSGVCHQFIIDGDVFFAEVYYAEEQLGKDLGVGLRGLGGADMDMQKYGFSLAVPVPRGAGDAAAQTAVAQVHVDGAALAAAVREAFAAQMAQWSRDLTREMVREMLPGLAERLVKEEIERIKREGL